MKFCNICGSQIDDKADTCPVCGTSFNGESVAPKTPDNVSIPSSPSGDMRGAGQNQPINSYNPGTPTYNSPSPAYNQYSVPVNNNAYGTPKKSNKAVYIIIAVAVALIAVAGIFFALNSGSSDSGSGVSYDKEIKTFMKEYGEAMENQETRRCTEMTIIGALSEAQVKELTGVGYYEALLGSEESLKEYFAQLDDEYGEGYEVSVKVNSIDYASKADIEELNEELEDVISVQEAAEVKITTTIADTKQKETLVLVRIDGQWYVNPF